VIMQQRYAPILHKSGPSTSTAPRPSFVASEPSLAAPSATKIAGDSFLQNQFSAELYKAILRQAQECPYPEAARRRISSLHAPEIECTGPFDRLRRQVPQALRVRRQDHARHHARPLKRRPVRHPRQDATPTAGSLPSGASGVTQILCAE
jgi:hypothetical protein